MEKYSVKKPFTVLVAVIAVIVLGFVSMTRITTDLLPQISLPYLLVITPYPGASPEKVETEVSKPMENALGTISNVENVNSVSSENFSMVQLEFTDGTNMDSAMVKVSGAVDQVSGSLPDTCPSPTIMEISMDMIATMYIGIEREGYDVYQLSDYVNEEVIPYIERQEGVGSISVIGTVDRTVEVRLNKEKITGVNNRLRREAESKMQDAQSKLDEAKEKVESGLSELQSQESTFGDTLASGVFSALQEPAKNAADTMKGAIGGMISKLQDVKSAMAGLNNAAETVKAAVADAQAAYDSAQADVETAQQALETAQTQYDEAVAALAEAGEEAEEEVIAGLTEAVGQAQEALDLAASDLTAAQEKLQEAANTLSETASQAAQTIDTADLEGRIDDIISGLNDAAENLNGDSITNLLNGVTKISQLVPQIQSAMSQLSAADTTGQLSDPIGAVESGSALAVESYDSCFHIAHLTVLVAQITVATKHHIVAVNLYDSVKNEVQRIGLGKHRVAHLGVHGLCEQCLVAPVLEERPHAEALQRQRNRVPLVNHLYDFGNQYGVAELLFCYFDISLWHTIADSLSGRQCRMKIPVVSTILVTVLHTLLNISLSHFIEEHDGSTEANASTGLNLSTLFCCALSIRVIAPSGAFTLR